MSITFNDPNADNGVTTGSTTYDSLSWTPTANSLIVAAAYYRGSASSPTSVKHAPGASEITLSSVVSVDRGTAGRIEILVGLAGASPPTGVTRATYAAAGTGGHVHVFDVTGADLSGGALAAIVQSKTAVQANTATPSVTLDAGAGAADNRCAAFFGNAQGGNMTPRTNWTEAGETTFSAPTSLLQTQWRTDSFEQTASASGGASTDDWSNVIIEIKAAASGVGATITPATETDTAPAVGVKLGINPAAETDTAIALGKKLGINVATETDVALALGKKLGIGPALEADAAQAVGIKIGIQPALELETAQPIGIKLGIVPALETDVAITITPSVGAGGQTVVVGTAFETDSAQAIGIKLGISPATEADIARAIGIALGIQPALELDEALAIAASVGGQAQVIEIIAALETDEAMPIGIKIGVATATETDEARPIGHFRGGGGAEGFVVWRYTQNPNKTKRRYPFRGGHYR